MSQVSISKFHELTEGNWRFSIYVRCDGCKYHMRDSCGDFLFIPDEAGVPILLPIRIAEQKYGLIDMGDCLGQMSVYLFADLYKHWLPAPTAGRCPMMERAISGP